MIRSTAAPATTRSSTPWATALTRSTAAPTPTHLRCQGLPAAISLMSWVEGSGVITSIEGMSPTNVENYTLDGLGNSAAGDTLDYTGTASAVIVNLGTNSATGFTSVTGIENVTGGSAGDTLSGDSNA